MFKLFRWPTQRATEDKLRKRYQELIAKRRSGRALTERETIRLAELAVKIDALRRGKKERE